MNKHTYYSDEDLVSLAQQGDLNAYNLLFSRYNTKIQKIIYLSIPDRASVSDLAQEVLIKVYRNLHYFKERSQFSTWMYRITQNTIKNHYRANHLRMNLEAEFADNYMVAPAQLSPEHVLMHMEFGKQLESAIYTLSKELRGCYKMYVIEGQSYENIAKKMDCPIGTVRSRISRARKILMTSLRAC